MVNTILEQPPVSLEKELTTHDRCDRCGAQAYMQAIKGNQDILFCAHHGRAHTDRLVLDGWTVLDSSGKLTTNNI